MPRLRVLSAASELYPLIKTGGLADVAGALPLALAAEGVETHSLIPGYPAVLAKLSGYEPVWTDENYFGGTARILRASAFGLDLFILDAPHLYARPGNPYAGPDGRDWPDNPQRFAALAYAAAMLGQGAVADFVPDLVHAHDWQTGLAPAYLSFAGGPRPASVMTIHNLAFQGQVPASLLASLHLPVSAYNMSGLEYYGAIGMLKAGLVYADRVTTVSPSYAAEICTPEGGMSLDGVLRARAGRVTGILNGIDAEVWNPATDPFVPKPFSSADRSGRPASKTAVQERFGLRQDASTLLVGVVSRFSHQKGLDVLLASLPALLAAGAQLAMVGAGDRDLQDACVRASAANPERIGLFIGYDERLAHLLQAGCDAILVPSRFEPCGLTQLCALRYGAIPVVARVGGLADTVIDANHAARLAGVATGLQFDPVTPLALSLAIERLAALWQLPAEWSVIQANGMRTDVSWAKPAKLYAALYRAAISGRG